MTHEQARAELEKGTPAEAICATCPWDRLCVQPPAISTQDVKRRVDEAERRDRERDPAGRGLPITAMLTALTYGGRDLAGVLCPVFASRLRGPDGRQIADGLRQQMRDWDGS